MVNIAHNSALNPSSPPLSLKKAFGFAWHCYLGKKRERATGVFPQVYTELQNTMTKVYFPYPSDRAELSLSSPTQHT